MHFNLLNAQRKAGVLVIFTVITTDSKNLEKKYPLIIILYPYNKSYEFVCFLKKGGRFNHPH